MNVRDMMLGGGFLIAAAAVLASIVMATEDLWHGPAVTFTADGAMLHENGAAYIELRFMVNRTVRCESVRWIEDGVTVLLPSTVYTFKAGGEEARRVPMDMLDDLPAGRYIYRSTLRCRSPWNFVLAVEQEMPPVDFEVMKNQPYEGIPVTPP